MKLFDSTVLIAHLRGVHAATRLLADAVAQGEASCSVLSRFEIEGGVREREWATVRRLFASMRTEPVTHGIAARAAEYLRRYRRSHTGIDAIDYLIAATADVLGGELLTLNVKHFPMIPGIKPAFL